MFTYKMKNAAPRERSIKNEDKYESTIMQMDSQHQE